MTNDEPRSRLSVCPACPWKPGSPQFAAANRGVRRSRVGEGQPYTFTAQRYTYPYTKTPGNAVYADVNEVEYDGDRERQQAASAGREQASAER